MSEFGRKSENWTPNYTAVLLGRVNVNWPHNATNSYFWV